MFAVVIQKTSWWQDAWKHFAFNWFDVALVLVLVFAYWRGRRRGMTKELLPTLQWVTIMLAAGLCHPFLADWFQQQGLVKRVFGNHFNERTAALMSAYLTIFFLIFVLFVGIRRRYHSKLEGSSFFGGNEYYWGIMAGLMRYVSLILIGLALLNAPFYTQADIAAQKAYNNRWFGGGLNGYSGDFIPTVYEVQDNVFKQSLVGPLIKSGLSMLLINTPSPVKTAHS